MPYRAFSRIAMLVTTCALVAGLALPASAGEQHERRGRKYKPSPPVTSLQVTVLRRDDNKPIVSAAVIFHLVGDKGNMEMKSDEDGKSEIDVLPTGSHIVLQIIAHGYQTYGGEYVLDKPKMAIKVRLNRPGKQYSIYDNHAQASSPDNASGKPRADEAAKDAGQDTPAESAQEEGSQSSADQPQQ